MAFLTKVNGVDGEGLLIQMTGIPARQISAKLVGKWVLWALAQLLLWTILAFGIAFYIYKVGSDVSWRELLLSGIAHYWSTALLAPIVVFLTRRMASRPWRTQALFHLAGVVVFFFAHPAVTVALIDWAPDMRPTYVEFLFAEMMSSVIQYAAIAGFAFVVSYSAEVQNRRIEEAALRAELAQAHMQVLRTQIHPDFLFNTFHEISRLMESDPESARSVMARLCEMLRIALDSNASQQTTLRESLELFECYLDLEKARLGSMFQFDLNAGNETLDAMVPRVLLQSVVETVLDTAGAPLLQPAFVNIQAERAVDVLHMAVEVGGPGLSHSEHWITTAQQASAKLQDVMASPPALRWTTLPDQTLRVEMEMPFAVAEII